jgi:hypothetical protein
MSVLEGRCSGPVAQLGLREWRARSHHSKVVWQRESEFMRVEDKGIWMVE